MNQNEVVLLNGLTQVEEDQLVEILGKLKSPMGTRVFDALMKRGPFGIAIEAVCLRFNKQGRVEVYLIQRAQEETAYPGEWHCPGSYKRSRETDSDVFSRLAEKEFGAKIVSTQFVFNVDHPAEPRGHTLSLVYLCVIEEQPGLRGRWFFVDDLPEKTVESHRYRIIPAAVGAFVAQNTAIYH